MRRDTKQALLLLAAGVGMVCALAACHDDDSAKGRASAASSDYGAIYALHCGSTGNVSWGVPQGKGTATTQVSTS